MYPNPLITLAQIRQKVEETRNVYGANHPLPDAYWYDPQVPPLPLPTYRKPETVKGYEGEGC